MPTISPPQTKLDVAAASAPGLVFPILGGTAMTVDLNRPTSAATVSKGSPIERFLSLRDGWAGRNSVAPSFDLINAAEKLWLSVKKQKEQPKIIPGAENMATFVWAGKYPDKEFHVRITDEDGITAMEWALFGKAVAPAREGTTGIIGEILVQLGEYLKD
jgi:hypothetical protein